jgi:uncharacterized protein YfaS (alpha-2-macroglobulin family)
MMGEEVQTMVHAISSGEPMSGVQVNYLWSQTGTRDLRSRSATTNKLGVASKLANNMPVLIVARHNNQVSFLTPQQNNLDLSVYKNVPARHKEQQTFLYGPRDLYRPGEVVNINMLLRDYDGRELDDTPVVVDIKDARGSKVDSFTWWPESSGIYLHEFSLDTNAPTGEWSLIVNANQPNTDRYTFKVEEFLPERLTMSYFDGAPEKYRYLTSRNGSISFNAQYLYGAPAAGNKANAIVTVSAATDLFEQWDSYRFGNPTERIVQKTRKIDDITLDENGDGAFRMPNVWSDITSPLKFRITGSVYESGGRPVTRSQSVISLPSGNQQFIGVRPQFKGRPKSNQTVKFDLINVDNQGAAISGTASIKLVRKNREYYWLYDESNGWNRRWRSDAYVAYTKTIEIDEAGSEIELPLSWGDYELEITSNLGTKTVYPFKTQYSWANQESKSLKPKMIDIILDQEHYLPGDEVNITYQTANSGSGILQIESSDQVIFTTEITSVEGNNSTSITLNEAWDRHDLYLTIMILSPADQTTNVIPKRSLGISHLPLRRANSTLEVLIDAPEKIEPNQTVTAAISVTNPESAQGAPIYATVAMVDMGVLNITNYKRPQPEQYFFAPRRFESRYLDMYGKVINNLGLKTYQQKFGGGFADSDDALARGGDKPQSEVQVISFISEPVQVINGKADVSFELPSFNGRVKWMVVAWSADAFGSNELEMTIADKLVTQLSLPRFLAMGDESQLTLDLHNLSDVNQELAIEINIKGSVTTPFTDQSLMLKDKEKRSIVVPITAIDYKGSGEISLSVTNGDDIGITRQWVLGVRAPFPLQTNVKRQVIESTDSWKPDIEVSDLISHTVKAQLTLSDKPAIDFSRHVDYLLRYPYGCLEQTTSSTYPWLLIDNELYTQLNLSNSFESRFNEPFSDALRRKQIESGLEKLLKKQKANGEFGYWNANSRVSFWGTAYATELLLDARELGMPVDSAKLTRALTAIEKMLKGNSVADIWTDNNDAYQSSYRAYGGYVMAKAKRTNVSDLRRLLSQMVKQNVSHSSLPWMHLAVAFKLEGDMKRSAQALAKALSVKRSNNRYYADYGSSLRDTSLSLALALENDLDPGSLATNLEDLITKRRWMSTQERISLLRVAKGFLKDGQNWRANIITSAFDQKIDQSTPFNTVINGDELKSIETIDAKERRIYANLLWQGVPLETPEARQNGMTIYRDYYDLKGNSIDFDEPIDSGTLIIARIDVKSLEYRFPEALVVDLLPAGFELENQNLLNASVNLDEISIDNVNVGEYFRNYRVDYQEYRDDRYVSSVSLVPWSSTTLFYLVRAVTPGTYSLPNSYVEDMYRPENHALSFSPGSLTVIQP